LGSEKKYDLIFVGRLVENKGLDLLLEIAGKTNYRILIVGMGPLYDCLKHQIRNRRLNIDMRGWANGSSEVSKLINESKALIMLSDSEGGPRVVLEALACEVPVIATPVGIAPDIINHNNGRIINWSADEAIEAFEEVKNIRIKEDLAQFDKEKAIKNYADKLKELIQ
ncbi:MAG: glycosyltransferase, partial [Candidatus Omnitrophica bacterium]|nr:glycosyltransferase [Candidatus Omnitrophota bacterium]